MRPGLYLLSFGGAVAVLVWVDQSPSEIANQASVLVLLLGAGLLGLIKPDWAWLSGVGLGSSLAAAHALYLVTGHPLPYASLRPDGRVRSPSWRCWFPPSLPPTQAPAPAC